MSRIITVVLIVSLHESLNSACNLNKLRLKLCSYSATWLLSSSLLAGLPVAKIPE
jgi:hypothetical protein